MDSKVSHQIRVGKRQLASSRTEYPSCSLSTALGAGLDNARNTGYICMHDRRNEEDRWRTCFCVLQRRWIGEGGRNGINRKIQTVNSIENSFSTVRLCKIVRGSKRDSKFRIKLGPWLLVDSNGTGRGWWSFVSWIVFKGETVPGLMACKWSG